MNLMEYKNIIDYKPMHIATVSSENKPNLSVASDVRVLDKNKIIISVNEMNNTQKNIQQNPNVVLTVFNEDWIGLRLWGKATFFNTGEYYDFCKKIFFSNWEITPFGAVKPKGAIVIDVETTEEFK